MNRIEQNQPEQSLKGGSRMVGIFSFVRALTQALILLTVAESWKSPLDTSAF
jgi:hypothetical protein